MRNLAGLQPIENLEEREDYGVHTVNQFTWKQLLDGSCCTECGRCNAVGPAIATEKPLWPKASILGVKEELVATGKLHLVRREQEGGESEAEPMVGGRIKDESLWACTNCGACVEICPVSIEHVQKIDDMRRYLVMEESRFPSEVQPLFTNLERNQNPWEISNDTRGEWAQAIGVKTLAEDPDAEVLYWVGCMGSFDARNRKVATAFAKVMRAANVRFGILGPEESCTGDPARRIGNEYLWYMLASQNVEVLNSYGFGKAKDAEAGAENGHNGHSGHSAPAEPSGFALPARPAHTGKTIAPPSPPPFHSIQTQYP